MQVSGHVPDPPPFRTHIEDPWCSGFSAVKAQCHASAASAAYIQSVSYSSGGIATGSPSAAGSGSTMRWGVSGICVNRLA